ncbi:MAG TPA: class I SAM-dependent methyltransferase [Kofleriaceae bacterium]|nr:class I SAM-dependent methyltransferase [Kofleriaceae bacterium]
MATPSSTAYAVGSFYVSGADHEVRRLRMQVDISWPKEAALLRRIGLRPDMSIVELGCGPGFVTEKLVTLVPDGSVTAIELDAEVAARTDARLRAQGCERYRIVCADVRRNDLPAGTFDLAFARYLFLHLPDPLAAMRETLRLLKPGGTLITLDIDATLDDCEPTFPEFEMLREGFENFFRLRGTDSRFGRRKQRRLLREAGFHEVEVDSVVVDSDELGTLEPFVRTAMDPDVIGRTLVALGLWSSDELERYTGALHRFMNSEQPFLFQARPVAWGRKPLEAP